MLTAAEKNLVAAAIALVTAYRSLAASWRSLGPSPQAFDDLVAETRRALKGIHSENSMSDADEIAAVETALALFDQELKPMLVIDGSRSASDLDP